MKHLSRALSLAALVCATLTQAGHLDSNSYSFNVGPTFNYARFKIGDRPDGTTVNLPKTQGYLAGIHADFMYEHACNVFAKVRFDGRWNAGNVSRFGPTDSDCQRFKVRDFRPEFNIGYTFAIGECESWELTPFTGVGYINFRTERRNVANNGEVRTWNNIYVPVGLQAKWLRDECFDVAIAAEYRIDARTRLSLRDEDATTSTKIDLKRTQGFLVEVPMTWHMDTDSCYDWHTKVVPFVDWNRFANRKENPNNETRLQQLYAGLHVDFGVHF